MSTEGPEPTVRSVRVDELPRLSEIDHKVFEDIPFPYFVLRQHFDAHRRNLLVLEHEGELRGYSLAVPASDPPDVGWYLALGVLPQWRGRGYGRRLADCSIELLRRQGVHQIRLTVDPTNSAAKSLYDILGFKLDESPVEDYFGPGHPRQLMTLELGSLLSVANGHSDGLGSLRAAG